MLLVCLTRFCRVKAIDIITIAIPPYSDSKSATYASTVSSDGFIRVFDLGAVSRALGTHATEQPVVVEPVTQYDTQGSRLTCVAVGDGELVADPQRVGKRKRDEGNDDEVNEVDDWPSEMEDDKNGDAGEHSEDKEDSSEQQSE
jgi:protein MAK11